MKYTATPLLELAAPPGSDQSITWTAWTLWDDEETRLYGLWLLANHPAAPPLAYNLVLRRPNGSVILIESGTADHYHLVPLPMPIVGLASDGVEIRVAANWTEGPAVYIVHHQPDA